MTRSTLRNNEKIPVFYQAVGSRHEFLTRLPTEWIGHLIYHRRIELKLLQKLKQIRFERVELHKFRNRNPPAVFMFHNNLPLQHIYMPPINFVSFLEDIYIFQNWLFNAGVNLCKQRQHLIVGGAITDNSIAEDEYEECLLKAIPMFKALNLNLKDVNLLAQWLY